MSDAPSVTPAPTALSRLASCQPGFTLLLEAAETAQELQRDVWDFAVEIHNLRSAGLTNTDLRRLVCNGYVEQAIEITRPLEVRRTFQAAGNLMLGERSCF